MAARHKKKGPSAAERLGPSQDVQLGDVDGNQDTPRPARLQARWLSRRFGLTEDRARLVASLAWRAAA